jgi:branched-chain amino acid aminotransferase
MAVCWLNGELVPKEKACVSVFDHGLLYGDGVFEGIRFYNGNAFMLRQHLRRLYQSATAVMLNIPYSYEELTQAIDDTITAYGKPSGYIRLVVTRGEGLLGVDPQSCDTPTVFIIADGLQILSQTTRDKGLRAVIVSTRRVPNISWDARIKSLNYLNNVLARLEARNAHADEAILLNQSGNVAEGALNNVFVVCDNVLLTPPTSDGALQGVTREVILQLAHENGIRAQQRSLTPYDLYTADECFLTGTGIELVALREVDGRPLGACPGPVFGRIRELFHDFVQRNTTGVKDLEYNAKEG